MKFLGERIHKAIAKWARQPDIEKYFQDLGEEFKTNINAKKKATKGGKTDSEDNSRKL